MSELSRHAVRQIAQAKNFQQEMAGKEMLLQVLDAQIYQEKDMKKNIKARIQLSDGNSKMTTMVIDKCYS